MHDTASNTEVKPFYEEEFLARLAEKFRRPFLVDLEKEEIKELKRLGLLYLEPLLDSFLANFEPKVASYVSPARYYVIPGSGMSISLATGRTFIGNKLQEGSGDVLELWSLFKGTNFYGAVQGLTEWLILFLKERERHRRSLCVPKFALVELKHLLWRAFEDKGFVAGKKVLFPKGNGKRTAWTSARGVWKLLQETYGEECGRSRYFASPPGVREFLDIWVGQIHSGGFEVRRRHRPKTVNLEEARKVEYSFVLTDIPLHLPPA